MDHCLLYIIFEQILKKKNTINYYTYTQQITVARRNYVKDNIISPNIQCLILLKVQNYGYKKRKKKKKDRVTLNCKSKVIERPFVPIYDNVNPFAL